MSDEEPRSTPPLAAPRRGISYFTFACIVVIIFVGGVVLGQRSDELTNLFSKKNTKEQSLNTDSLQQTYQALERKYDGRLDTNKLLEGASRGLVDAAGDPYTVYFNAKEAREFSDDLDGTFSGIGAELGKENNKLVVVSPLEGSPAETAGLMAGDIISLVNGEDTSSWSIDKAVSKIKGKQGTTVKLTILRQNEPKDFTITREVITASSVKTEKKGNIGIIRISRFGDDTAARTRRAALDFKDQNVQGIIVDLRDNGGGYLESAQEIASLWLSNGKVVVTERAGSKVTDTHRASGATTLKDIPTIVLINNGSASASEIVAGALQDHKAARLVGEKSFGKGSVQQVVNLQGGTELKVTVAKWYTPNGSSINKKGIEPDVKIASLSGDNGRDRDAQMDKATQLLQQ